MLAQIGLQCTVQVADIDESHRAGESPRDYVSRMAREKLHAVDVQSGQLLLAADTVVCINDNVLGKPRDIEHAMNMWHALGGR